VRARTYRSTLHLSLRELLISLNQTLRGWANYFRYGVSKDVFGAVDSYAWRRIASWLARKHSRLSRQQMRRRFCQPGSWKIAHDGIAFTGASSVAVTRYRYRGHHIPSPWTPAPAALTG
jgi:RNA-directed DNA polymerase